MTTMATRRLERVVADTPGLMALWDTEANVGVDPATLGARSSRGRFWRCPVAEDHAWQAGPQEQLVKKDEGTMFRLANEFGIRHQNAQQQADYDPVFLDWVFWFYLATVEVSDRLLAPGGIPAGSARTEMRCSSGVASGRVGTSHGRRGARRD